RDRNVTGVQTCALPILSFEEKHADEKKGRDLSPRIFDVKRKVFRVKRVIIPMEELAEKFEEQDDIITSTRSEVLLDRVNSKIDRQKLIIRFSEEMIDELKDNYRSEERRVGKEGRSQSGVRGEIETKYQSES